MNQLHIRIECLRIAASTLPLNSSKEQVLERAKTFAHWASETGSEKSSVQEQGDAPSNARNGSAQAGSSVRK